MTNIRLPRHPDGDLVRTPNGHWPGSDLLGRALRHPSGIITSRLETFPRRLAGARIEAIRSVKTS